MVKTSNFMADTAVESSSSSSMEKGRPTIVVPPRGSTDSLFTNGLSELGFSPGPMTLVSGFFADQGSTLSFSQLLGGTVVSPMVAKQGSVLDDKSGEDERSGYKQNRPVNLAVAQPKVLPESHSPLFLVPPGLSPSGLLNSPAILPPIQSPFGMSHQQALAHVTAQATLSQSYVQMTDALQAEEENSKTELPEAFRSDKRVAGQKPASDGYHWRKYGQKNVKASECPRSYYKCTYPNCPVRKKVEQTVDGHISEIIYKGHHNHDPPQNSWLGKDNSRTIHSQQMDSDSESLNNGSITIVDGNDNDDDDDDGEPAAKKRAVSDLVPFRQTITESKIVVQTRSEVDLLDDGYKWRKYGQKVVKGNPHPRSYYRCTYTGCNVRKHVERSSADHKAVITTYEGKHDHEIPTGRHVRANKNGLEIGNNDEQMPLTLHLKHEQIAA